MIQSPIPSLQHALNPRKGPAVGVPSVLAMEFVPGSSICTRIPLFRASLGTPFSQEIPILQGKMN
jgi:hypothetical protein